MVVYGTGHSVVQFFISHRRPADSGSTLQIEAFSQRGQWARSGEALISPMFRSGAELVLVVLVRPSSERSEVRQTSVRISVRGNADEES